MNRFHQVCVIDDDPVYVYCVKRLLNVMDIAEDLMVFENGKDALCFFSNKLVSGEASDMPNLILLDINMPVMNGWQFLESFTQLPNHDKVKVYLVSSSMDPIDLDKVIDYKHLSLDYIVKPITKGKVENMLERLA